MSGILSFFESPVGQGLLAAGFGALAGRGNRAQAIGQGGLLGLQAFGQAKDDIAQRERRAKQDKLSDLQYQQAMEQASEAKAINDMARQFSGSPLNQAMSAPGRVGPTPERAQIMQNAPQGFDQEGFLKAVTAQYPLRGLQMRKDMAEKAPAPIKVGAGESVIDPVTFKPVYSAPEKVAPTELGRYLSEMQNLPPNSPLRGLYQSAISKTTTHAPGTNVSINTGQRGLDNEFKLRGEFKGEPVYKAHQEMQAAYNQIRQSLGQASPAGDLAGATKIMKLLDPGSVVRESELGMAMQASGLMDRVTNYANMVITGQKLTPTQRKDFQNLADALYSESVKQYNSKRTEYERFGSEYGLDAGRALGPGAAMPKTSDGWSIKPKGGQ